MNSHHKYVIGHPNFSRDHHGNIVHGRDDLIEHICRAHKQSRIVRLVAGQNSWFPQIESNNYVIHNWAPGNPEVVRLDSHLIRVSGRSVWSDVVEIIGSWGLQVPVLTRELKTTVGGTLASGGFGERSFSRGAQADSVIKMEIILQDGRICECSSTEKCDLFDLTLFGRGQTGIIESAVFAVEPVPEKIYAHIFEHRSLVELIRSHSRVCHSVDQSKVDGFLGQFFKRKFISTYTTSDYRPPRISGVVSQVSEEHSGSGWIFRGVNRNRQFEADTFLAWYDYVLPEEEAESFAAAVESKVFSTGAHIRLNGRVLVLSVSRTGGRRLFPFDPIPRKSSSAIGFGVYFTISRNSAHHALEAERLHEFLLDKCLSCGGLPYIGPGTRMGHRVPDRYAEAQNSIFNLMKRYGLSEINSHAAVVPLPIWLR